MYRLPASGLGPRARVAVCARAGVVGFRWSATYFPRYPQSPNYQPISIIALMVLSLTVLIILGEKPNYVILITHQFEFVGGSFNSFFIGKSNICYHEKTYDDLRI